MFRRRHWRARLHMVVFSARASLRAHQVTETDNDEQSKPLCAMSRKRRADIAAIVRLEWDIDLNCRSWGGQAPPISLRRVSSAGSLPT
jgi:hypothetical protein